MNNIDLLKPFCSTNADRPLFCNVWHIGNALYASNTHYLAKLVIDEHIDKPIGYPDNIIATPPNFEKVIWESSANYLEFNSDNLYAKGGLLDSWIKAFKFISSLKSEYKEVILSKVDDRFMAYSIDEGNNNLGVIVQLAKNEDYTKNSNSPSCYRSMFNSKYILTILQTIKEYDCGKPIKFYFRKKLTDSMKIECGNLTFIITPVLDSSELHKFFYNNSGYSYSDWVVLNDLQ